MIITVYRPNPPWRRRPQEPGPGRTSDTLFSNSIRFYIVLFRNTLENVCQPTSTLPAMVVSTINKESFKEPMTSRAVAAADIHSSVELPPLTWSTPQHMSWKLCVQSKQQGKTLCWESWGRRRKSPLPPSSFLHLALHDVIQAALAAPLWDQREELWILFCELFWDLFLSLPSVRISLLSIRVNYQTKPMVQTDADKNNWTNLETKWLLFTHSPCSLRFWIWMRPSNIPKKCIWLVFISYVSAALLY